MPGEEGAPPENEVADAADDAAVVTEKKVSNPSEGDTATAPSARTRGAKGRAKPARGKRGKAGSSELSRSQSREQEGQETRPLARRSSNRERVKPKAYSPTHQDRDTKLRRERLKQQERAAREASQAGSEDVVVKREPNSSERGKSEAADDGEEVGEEAVTGDSKEAGEEEGSPSAASDDIPLQLAKLPSKQRAKTAQQQQHEEPATRTPEEAVATSAVAGAPAEHSGEAAGPVPMEVDAPAPEAPEDAKQAVAAPATKDAPGEEPPAGQLASKEPSPAEPASQEAPAAQSSAAEPSKSRQPPEPEPLSQEQPALVQNDQRQPQTQPSAAQEATAAKPAEGKKPDPEAAVPAAEPAAEPPSGSNRHQDSEAGGAAEAPVAEAGPEIRPSPRKRLRGRGDQQAQQPKPKATPKSRRAAAQHAAPDPKRQKRETTPPPKPVAEPAGKAKSATANPPPAAAAGQKQSLAQNVARRNDALSAGHKQIMQIFAQAQAQAQEVLTAMAADIQALDALTVTEEVLQQTGIGKTVRMIAKPLKPLQPVADVEKRASVLVMRWMKAFGRDSKPATQPAPAAPAAPRSAAATQPAQAEVAAPKPAAAQKMVAAPSARRPSTAEAAVPKPAAARAEPSRGADQGAAPPPARPHSGTPPAGEAAAKAVAPPATTAAAAPQAKEEAKGEAPMRAKARMILEAAFMPPGFIIPPTSAASRLEAALHQHFGEEDLASGKRYLRRLRAVWGLLAHDSPSQLPQLRELVATGKLHPADLATLPGERLAALVRELKGPELLPEAEQPPPPPPLEQS